MTAAERWRDALVAWAIPDDLLAAAEESPYGWPPELWRRRSVVARTEQEPLTLDVARSLLGSPGSVLDAGAGMGRASLPLAAEGHALTAVERDPGMVAGLRAEAAERGVEVRVVEGSWPEAAPQVGQVDLAVSAHVVYDVQDLAPFLAALDAAARRGVVLEVTESHPWSNLAPYYRVLHGLDRPVGPTVDDLVAVVREVCEVEPRLERWERPAGMWFEDRDEIVAFYRRRLVVPASRSGEVWALIEPQVVEHPGGRLTVGDDVRRLATVWWENPSTGY